MAEEKTNVALAEAEEKKSEEKKNKAKDDKKDAKQDADAPVKGNLPEAEDGEEEEEEVINTDELFKRRPSISLNPDNARFAPSKGGMISLTVQGENGEEFFERVIVLRSFPVTAPDEFLSVREPDTRKKGRGAEIGMIRYLSDFDEETKKLINAELDLRYFTPVIQKILSVKDKFGYSYWEVETTAGKVSFVLNNPFSQIRVLEDMRIYISDMDGNSFVIPDPTALDRASYRRIEVYI